MNHDTKITDTHPKLCTFFIFILHHMKILTGLKLEKALSKKHNGASKKSSLD